MKIKNAIRTDLFRILPEDLFTKDDPDHPLHEPRSLEKWDDALESMLKSIFLEGVLEPVEFFKEGQKKFLVFGRRRVRACIEANRRILLMRENFDKFQDADLLSDEFDMSPRALQRLFDTNFAPIRVPCVNSPCKDKARLPIRMTMENTLRKDVDPIVLAKRMALMYEALGSYVDVATTFNTTTDTVKKKLELLDCIEPIQELVSEGKCSQAQARGLKDKPEKEQADAVRLIEQGKALPKEPKPRGLARKTQRKLYERLDPTSREGIIVGAILGLNALPEDLQPEKKRRGPKPRAELMQTSEEEDEGSREAETKCEEERCEDPTLPADDVELDEYIADRMARSDVPDFYTLEDEDADVDYVPDSQDLLDDKDTPLAGDFGSYVTPTPW